MSTLRRLLRLLAPAICAVLASCIDGREEYWLAADGSGRAEIRYEVPAAFATGLGGTRGVEEMLDRFVRETPTLSAVTRNVTRRGDRLTVEFKAAFGSAEELIAAVSGESALTPAGEASPLDPLIGRFDIRQQGTRVAFERTVSPGRALPGSALLPSSQLRDRRLTYILHLPVAAWQSNATRTDDHGRTLIWEHPLDSGTLAKFSISFQADLPLPWRRIAAAAVAICLLAALGTRLVLRSRRRPPAPTVT